MQRTGNNIGAEGRRQHNEDDPQSGDLQRMQERLADAEIQEGREEVEEEDAEESAGARLETSPQADGVPGGQENRNTPEPTEKRTGRRPEDDSVTADG